ncbi:hypothetical protein BG011_007345 [Mortierella polycephala]|uniref:Uncharacterized protein n=1 Tax=Mortierella polycephala TaxID=41804 RepID=A0A9P6TXV0_9FUNG|nr:hypothetical protein BG011_007345 [Mortierella polycephala]
MTLTTHSLSRMVFMRRTGSKYHLFPIINIAQLVNQFSLWLNVISHFAYFITKLMALHLAYLRCSAIFSAFTRADPLHFSLISMRVVELFVITVVSIIQNYKCEGLAIAFLVRDTLAPLFRLYYILCEAIFYVKLFWTLTSMNSNKNVPLIQYRRLRTTLLTADLIILIFMSKKIHWIPVH